MSDFKPIVPTNETLSLKYQLQKLYGEAWPSLSSKALYKLDGAKDLAKGTVSDLAGLGFKPSLNKQQPANLDFSGVELVGEITEAELVSYLGTPIFFPIRFNAGKYNVYDSAGKLVQKEFENDYLLPASATAELSRTKKWVTSEVNGPIGSVKELWSFSDWQVNIRGLILTEGTEYNGRNSSIFPEKELIELFKWESIADSIEVTGKLFEIAKIKRLCVSQVQIGQQVGSPFAIPFMITCVSDEALEFSIANNLMRQ